MKHVDAAPRTLISTLWLVVFLQIIFKDIHALVAPGFLDEISTGMYNGTPLTEELFLLGALIVQLPIWAIALTQALTSRAVGWLNLIAATYAAGIAFLAWPADLDDWFHLAAQYVALAWIATLAWPLARKSQAQLACG